MNSPSPELPELLASIRSHADLMKIPESELPRLAEEIRNTLIHSLSLTGGHLGPNLGVVELSIALHRVFETPRDKIIFDVSHQAYVHKMLTGRAPLIHTIRQHGGLSGFAKMSESPHDSYGAGHAGTALSAALGMCAARDLKGEDYHVVAVAGDAAFTCGTTLEALNNISQTTKRYITILNDNEWAIDKNVGALAKYFNSLQTSETFSWLRDKTASFIEKLGGTMPDQQTLLKFIGPPLQESFMAYCGYDTETAARGVEVFRERYEPEGTTKNLIFPSLLFNKFGLRYFGPLDGHDIPTLIRTLAYIKDLNEPVILHVVTQKGKGYQPALDNPTKFHGLGSYCVRDGETQAAPTPTFSHIFGSTLVEMAREDESITAITAAMASGTKLDLFKEAFPKRYFDVGIAEEHGALFACGLAAEGMKPYIAIYSTFMQRCIDMIQHDAALQKLPVRFCMDRAGLSPDDGPTHHGLFDIAMIRSIPNIVFMQPKDEAEFVHMLRTMNHYQNGPTVIRYPRGCGAGTPVPAKAEILPIGKAEVLQTGQDVTLVSLGTMIGIARETASLLEARGYTVTLINARFIKPLDDECIRRHAARSRVVCTFEDHSISGGFNSAVLESLETGNVKTPVEAIVWPDQFIEHGSESILRKKYGLTAEAALQKIIPHLNS